MCTKNIWKQYLEGCNYYCGNFCNDYAILPLVILLTPITLIIDIVLSPVQLLSLIFAKIIEYKYWKKKFKNKK